ncbi:hypothetical protein ACFSO7_18070 [Bacillus sp. CGMCC 1.16607]|uniref:YphA family membrane protein n=1 Tax=Bacillus sp. CGMCC 1.16607 TaxID=3351842 RepID=UPI0036335EFE
MEGLYFYGFCWTVWIITTFLANKNNHNRLPYACYILMIIIFSPYTFTIENYSVSYVAILILFLCFFKIALLPVKRKCYLLISSLIIGIGFVAFQLFELFDPIWIIFKREWLLGGLLTYLTVLLQQKLIWRIITVVTGCIYGEFIFAMILHRYTFPYTIGSFVFLDVCSFTITMLIGWSCIKSAIGYFENHIQTITRGSKKQLN